MFFGDVLPDMLATRKTRPIVSGECVRRLAIKSSVSNCAVLGKPKEGFLDTPTWGPFSTTFFASAQVWGSHVPGLPKDLINATNVMSLPRRSPPPKLSKVPGDVGFCLLGMEVPALLRGHLSARFEWKLQYIKTPPRPTTQDI